MSADTQTASLVGAPLFFNRNRVYRIYRGGKLFHEFFADAAEDGHCPEEWIASATRARNEGPRDEREGLSTVKGTPCTAATISSFPRRQERPSRERRCNCRLSNVFHPSRPEISHQVFREYTSHRPFTNNNGVIETS